MASPSRSNIWRSGDKALKFLPDIFIYQISSIRLQNRHKLMETPITQAIYCECYRNIQHH